MALHSGATLGVVGVAAVCLAVGVPVAAHGATTVHWKRSATVTTGTSQLAGPFTTDTPAGTIVAAYADTMGTGNNTTTSLYWRALRATGWSRRITATTNILSPRAVPSAVAASDTRVVTVAPQLNSAGTVLRFTLAEQRMNGNFLFRRSLGSADLAAVAIDARNNVMALTIADVSGHTTLTARHLSAAGQVSKPHRLQTVTDGNNSNPMREPAAVTVGRDRFLVTWLDGHGDSIDSTVHTANYRHGAWTGSRAITAAGRSVVDAGLASNAHTALLAYAVQTNAQTGAVDLRAITIAGGRWGPDRLVDANPNTLGALQDGDAVAADGQAEITNGRAYTLPAGTNTWRRGPVTPTASEYCGGQSLSSAYQHSTVHWFLIADKASGSHPCVMADFALS